MMNIKCMNSINRKSNILNKLSQEEVNKVSGVSIGWDMIATHPYLAYVKDMKLSELFS